MLRPGELQRALDWLLDSPAGTAAAMVALLALPVMAGSGAPSSIESREFPQSRAYPRDPRPAYNYEMRCYQHGRLLFEHDLLDLPGHPLKASGSDRDGRPVYVDETGNATCLIRGVADAGPPPGH